MNIVSRISRRYRYLFFLNYLWMKKSWSYVDKDPWLGGLVILSLSEVSNVIVVSYILHDVFHLYFTKLTKPVGYGICFGLMLLNYLVLVRRARLERIKVEFADEPQNPISRNMFFLYGYWILSLALLVFVPYATSHLGAE